MALSDESDLPDELQSQRSSFVPKTQQDDTELLDAVGKVISDLRKEAVDDRKASGLEEIWLKCEEAYIGMDDVNRHQFSKAHWAKPTSMSGPLQRESTPTDKRSTAFVRLTARYVDMGSAKIAEITDSIDDKIFSIKPTPVPTLTGAVDDKTPLTEDGTGKQVFRPVLEGETPTQPVPAHGMVPATVGDHAKAIMDQAGLCAEKAETRIFDWMVEAAYPAQKRKLIFEAARLGAGVLKTPYPDFKTAVKRVNKKLQWDKKLVPGMRSISLWNFYPAPGCGEDIHDGDYTFECDKITEKKLNALKDQKLANGTPIYIASQIDKVIAEGPDKCITKDGGRKKTHKKQFVIWYYTGKLGRKEMKALNAVGVDELPDELVEVNAIVTMVNDSPIRATLNPLESGGFPYRVLNWSRRDGSWAGVGVGEQLFMPQSGVNAATRALLNHSGLASGLQILMDRAQIKPADGDWVLTPNKIWELLAGATTDDMRKIFQVFEFPNIIPQLMQVIDYHFKLAEEATNIPLVTQGQAGDNAPETFGQANLQNNNAHTLLRAVANSLADDVEEPAIRDLYEWLLLDDDVPEEEKGDFQINAKGSVVLVEQAIQEQVFAQMLPLAKDPAYGWNPKKIASRFLKAKRIDPGDVEYTDAELAQMAQQPPPEAPVVTAAKIRSASDEKIAAGQQAAETAAAQAKTDRDAAYNQVMENRVANEHEATMAELALRERLAILDYANKKDVTIEEIKAKLADKAMSLNVQKQLSAAALSVDLHKHHNPVPNPLDKTVVTPPTEPAGKAQNGQAFAQ